MRNSILISALVLSLVPATSGAVVLNEWVSNDISGDDYEFIELCGEPGESLDGLSVVIIEGEGTGKGLVDRIIGLTGYSIGSSGFFVIGDPNVSPDLQMSTGFIENGGNNIILVLDVVQGTGTDIDTDDDCVEDLPIGTVIDAVGYGVSGDCYWYYGGVPVGPDGSYDPAGGARCCDCVGSWEIICLNGTEPTGPGCADPYMVVYATPGGPNDCVSPSESDETSWTGVKALYR